VSHVTVSALTHHPVHHRTARINGRDVFYREAGPPDAPVLLLLHGFPTSSNMFRNLIRRLAGSFRLVALDYPGFGQSSMPDRERFAYTFENLTNVVEALIEDLGIDRFSLYVMDYGAPIGYRLALRRPERSQVLVVQNGNAYEEGFGEFSDPIKRYWRDPRPENRTALHFVVAPDATRWQYENGVADRAPSSPTAPLVRSTTITLIAACELLTPP
jgi:pimeloyl-ACP methyl ester carboxylesterase